MKISLRRERVKWARRGGHALPEIDRLNKDVEEVIEDEEDVSARESTKGKWAELAKLVGRLRDATPGQGAKERVEEIGRVSGGALRDADERAGRQGDGRGDEPGHLTPSRAPLRRASPNPAGLSMSVGPLAFLHCPRLFDEIIKLLPEWAGTKLTKDGKDIGWNHEDGAIRIVMTGTASDRPGLQDHVYSKGQKKRGEVASVQFSGREDKTR